MRKAAKVLTILGMCLTAYLIFPVVLGIIGLQKMDGDYSRKEKRLWGLLVTFFVSVLGGIFMLCTYDESDGVQNIERVSTSDKKVTKSLSKESRRVRQLKYFCDKGAISESLLNEKKTAYLKNRSLKVQEKPSREDVVRLMVGALLVVFASICFVMTFAYCFVETSYLNYVVPVYTERSFWEGSSISSLLIVLSFGFAVLLLFCQIILVYRHKNSYRETVLVLLMFQTGIMAMLILALCLIAEAMAKDRVRSCELLPGGIFIVIMIIASLLIAIASIVVSVYDFVKRESFVAKTIKRRKSYKKISDLILLMDDGVLSKEELPRFSSQYLDNL